MSTILKSKDHAASNIKTHIKLNKHKEIGIDLQTLILYDKLQI